MSNPQWLAATAFAQASVIIDSNGNVQQCATAGVTGSQPPIWASVVNGMTVDGTVVWNCVAVLETVATPAALANLPAPMFITDSDGLDPNLIVTDMVNAFQTAAGRTLQPAQVERLLINLYAYRESLVRNAIQYAAQQNLLAFARFPMLDYLGQLLGVTRLAAQPALTTIEFQLVNALTVPLTIAAGTQVGTADGAFIFATTQDLVIAAGQTVGSVGASCTTPGAGGNGYLAGQINVLVAPNALVASAANTTTSSGGATPESDDDLRARIQLAPNRFSSAGPSGAYKFFALGVDPSIIDAQVVSPAPGQVTVYVLTGPITTQPVPNPNSAGIAGAPLLAKVTAALSAQNVRPLCDTVSASAVVEVDYQITGTVTLYADADPTAVQAAVNQAAIQFAINLAARIQRDIVPEEIIAALGSLPGVYRVVLSSPVYTQLTAGQWANCTAINLTVNVGSENS